MMAVSCQSSDSFRGLHLKGLAEFLKFPASLENRETAVYPWDDSEIVTILLTSGLQINL